MRADPSTPASPTLGAFLEPGDLLVVNTSATVPAALDGRLPDGEPVVVHLSGELPGAVWLVEVRRPDDGSTQPRRLAASPDRPVGVDLLGGGRVHLLDPVRRLDPPVGGDARRSRRRSTAYLARPRPPDPLPARAARLAARDATRPSSRDEPGSAEMPSASRPFTARARHRPGRRAACTSRRCSCTPACRRSKAASARTRSATACPRDTAAMINAVRAGGGHVVAAGTTVVRALATVTDDHGVVHPGAAGPTSWSPQTRR